MSDCSVGDEEIVITMCIYWGTELNVANKWRWYDDYFDHDEALQTQQSLEYKRGVPAKLTYRKSGK